MIATLALVVIFFLIMNPLRQCAALSLIMLDGHGACGDGHGDVQYTRQARMAVSILNALRCHERIFAAITR